MLNEINVRRLKSAGSKLRCANGAQGRLQSLRYLLRLTRALKSVRNRLALALVAAYRRWWRCKALIRKYRPA